MANQIKRKYIASDAIDGNKLKIGQGQAVRADDSTGTTVDLVKLSADDKVLLKGQEAALKSQVDAEQTRAQAAESSLSTAIANEIVRAGVAESSLSTAINTEKSRVDAILLASDADKDSFAEIVALVNSVDTTNDQAFASYVLSNNEALSDEVARAQAAESSLSTSISNAITSANAEAWAYTDGKIATEVTSRDAAILVEKNRAQAAESGLQSSIDAVANDLADEMGMFRDQAITAALSQFKTDEVDPVAQDVVDEVARAQAAESSLSTAIATAKGEANSYTDGKIATEVTSRDAAILVEKNRAQAAESGLQSSIDAVANDLADEMGMFRDQAITAALSQFKTDEVDPVAQDVVDEVARAQAAESSLSTAIANEIVRAGVAESSLSTAINTEKSRVDAILLASDADKDSFAEIVALINSVDTTNDEAFASYVLSNNEALSDEVARAQAAETSLATSISNLNTGSSAAVAAEQTRAQAAETSLATSIANEITRAGLAETSLATSIANEITRAGLAEASLSTSIADEIVRAGLAEASLSTAIATAKGEANSYTDGKIATEVTSRDAAILVEKNRAQAAESGLQSSIDTVADELASEINRAQTAEDGLDTRVLSLEADHFQFNVEKFTLSMVQVANGYIDLAYEADSNSLNLYADRLAMHEGEDYSVSVFNGKTRITFMGSMASGGAEALVANDLVVAKYAHRV